MTISHKRHGRNLSHLYWDIWIWEEDKARRWEILTSCEQLTRLGRRRPNRQLFRQLRYAFQYKPMVGQQPCRLRPPLKSMREALETCGGCCLGELGSNYLKQTTLSQHGLVPVEPTGLPPEDSETATPFVGSLFPHQGFRINQEGNPKSGVWLDYKVVLLVIIIYSSSFRRRWQPRGIWSLRKTWSRPFPLLNLKNLLSRRIEHKTIT